MPPRRALATAVGYRPADEIPFEGMGNISLPFTPSPGSAFGDAHPWEPARPLYLGGSVASSPAKYRLNKGVGGDLSEIQSVFDACLQVGRIERAGVILKRISMISAIDPNEMVTLQNRYLRAYVEQIMTSNASREKIHKFYELDIRLKGLPQTTETLAYMVKASLQSPTGKRERLVRRYMDMLDEDAALQLLEAEVLTAREINEITQIYPKYNFSMDMEEEYEALEDEDFGVALPDSPHAHVAIPDVRSVGQKGLGLKSLKKSLSLFSTLPTEGIDLSSASPEMKRDIQARLEEDAVQSAIDRWRDESAHLTKMGLNSSLQTKSLGARMWKWQVALEEYLKEEIAKVDAAEAAAKLSNDDADRVIYGPFLRLLPPDKLSAVTILSTMMALGSLGADKGVTLSNAIMAIAKSIEEESTFEVLQNESRKKIWPTSKFGKQRLDPKALKRATRMRGSAAGAKAASLNLDQAESTSALQDRQWPLAMKAKVGAFLMSALIEVAKVPVSLTHAETGEILTQMQPAFSHSHQYKMGKKLGVVMANKSLVSQLKREPVHSLLAKHLPMLVTPDPWVEFSKGGFISHPAKIMRIKAGDKDQRHYAEAAIGQGDMAQTFKGLDVLGKTAWRINQPVFDVMLEAWNSGEGIANMPPETPNLTIPPEPESSQDPMQRRRWIRDVKIVENTRSGMHSQRCFQNFQLEIARALRNESFYFPHNVDFRGRAYPIPPYLNHMGADHCRGLLKFGEGKELGEAGLRWLKIHLANVFGFDKASLSEREAFATKHLEKIQECATNPLAGSRWWLNAEDPWQFLAACLELRNALASPDPAKFVSHLPVHQDGTCNGLQHYAALGGDVWGAKQVNLEPGDRPADVYSAVANLVKQSIAEDKAKEDPLAIILDGKVTRKVVKQTVMTNVYGVTYIGAKAQVRRQLVAAHHDLPNDDKVNPGMLASYVAKKIFDALSTMFKGAHDIQYWLGDCASRISTCLTAEQILRLESEWPRLTGKKAPITRGYKPATTEQLSQFKSSVIWTTPLRMPVVQPYRTSKSKTINTNMQALNLSEPHRSDPVSKRKQLQGFPPNFIHSLDATHMLLSALKCDELGLSFAAVHDSFWTHASDIDTMNTVLRDAFIRIHSEDVVGRLRAEFTARYQGSMYIANLRPDSAVYRKIVQWRETKPRTTWTYGQNRKAPHLDELVLERQRMQLLSSTDPADVEKGKKMVTPTSIFQDHAADGDLVPENLEDVGLGNISARESQVAAYNAPSSDQLSAAEQSDDKLVDTSVEDQDGEDVDSDKEANEEEADISIFEKRIQMKKYITKVHAHVWLPLTFPPVPQKVSSITFPGL